MVTGIEENEWDRLLRLRYGVFPASVSARVFMHYCITASL